MKQGRKKFLKQLGAGLFAAGLPAIPLAADADESSMDTIDFLDEGLPDDERYWKRIARKYYAVADDYFWKYQMKRSSLPAMLPKL